MDFDDLVRRALKISGLKQGQFAAEMGVAQGTVSRWLSGKAKPEIKHWLAVKAFMARHGESEEGGNGVPSVPLIGAVGAGAMIVPLDNGDAPLEYLDPPFKMPQGTVCVQVRGDSMYPRYFDGELIYYRSEAQNPGALLGRECVVKLSDGRMLVKILRRGSGPGLFTLESWNSQPIEDVVIEYAAPVAFVDRR